MSYRELEVWKLARELVIEIHGMTLNDLPKFEMYEEGSQIRRSSKSTKSTIVEGYGRRQYKNDFVKYLNYSLASNIETIDHLENLYETKSLTNEALYEHVRSKLETLGRKLHRFIQTVEKSHRSPK